MPKLGLKAILQRQKKFAEYEVDRTMSATAYDVRDGHDKVVLAWDHKVRFEVKRKIEPGYRIVKILATGPHESLWLWVDQGTKAHVIKAKTAPYLRFRTGYSARTARVARANVGTGQATGGWVQTEEVNHPGTEAREFSQDILDKLKPPLHERVQDAVTRGYAKANR